MAFVLPSSFDELSQITGLGRPANTENNPALMQSQAQMKASRPAPTTDFVGNIGHSLAQIPGAVGNFIGHTIADPAVGMFNVGKGIIHNVDNVSHQISNLSLKNNLQKQNMDNHKLLAAGKMSQADFNAKSEALYKQYQAADEAQKKLRATTYTPGTYLHDIAPAAMLGATLAAPVLRPAIAAATGTTVAGKAALAASKVVAPVLDGVGPSAAGINGVQSAVKLGASVIGHQAINNMSGAQIGATGADLSKGNFAGAAGNAALLAAPLGIGVVAKFAPKLGEKVATAMYGKQGFFQAVAKNGGPDMVAHLDSLSGAAQKRVEGLLRQVQQYNVDQFSGDAKTAGAHFVEYLKNNGRDLEKMTAKDLTKELQNWVTANRTFTKLHAAGELRYAADGPAVELKDGQRIIAARFDPHVASQVQQDLTAAAGQDARKAVIEDYVKSGADWTKNPTLLTAVKSAAASGDDVWAKEFSGIQKMRSLFNSTERGVPAGYVPAISKSARADFKTVGQTAAIDRGKDSNIVLGKIGKTLDKLGIGTNNNRAAAAVKFRADLAGELKAIPGIGTPKAITAKMANTAEHMRGVIDERQIGIAAIKDNLGVTHEQAKAISAAYKTAYNKQSFSELGLAGKIDNALYKVPGYGTYRRIQGIGKYELNPFFRTQESTETSVLAHIMSGGKSLDAPGVQTVKRIFGNGKSADAIDSTVKTLHEKNIFAGGGFGSSGAQEGYSQVSARLMLGQKRSIAGLVNTMAEKKGMSAADFIDSLDPKQLDNIVSVVQYPKSGLSSTNFAKTLNLVAFPTRYNIKLASMLGKALAEASPTTQIATLKAAADLSTFLHSDAGIKWKAQNSEAIGIINYLNPLNNLSSVFKLVSGEHVGLSDLGQLGGLPLGFIASALQDTGIAPKPNSAYLNPKTGEVVPDKIPTSTGGYVKTVLADLINSMYSFPGRSFGTTISKTQLTQSLPGLKMKPGDQTDAPAPALTPQQQRTQAVLGAGAKGSVPTAPVNIGKSVPATTTTVPVTMHAPVKASSLKARKAKVYGIRPN